MSAQLTFDLPHRAAMGREDFLVAAPNAEAVAWVDRWPDWPPPGLALYGPPGCGKSHLSEVWRARSGARHVSINALTDGDVAALGEVGAPALVLDRAEGALPEEALLHLYNLVAERRGFLLVTGRLPPSRWAVALADLRSRLSAIASVAMGPPDDALFAAVLVKMFADRQLDVSAEVIGYLGGRLERSFATAGAVVEALDRAALAEKRRLTVPLARQVLAQLP